ncbi:MAG: alpha/beta fold hydrolase [Myxococcota bacterium]
MGLFQPTRTRPFTDEGGHPLPGSVATLERVRLGGLDQLVVTRGADTKNPLLLWLHGGPGASDLGALTRFNPELERRFTVVHWSQPGTAQSFDPRATPESLGDERLIADAVEIARRMLARFGQEKLVVAGQSMGTTVGLTLARRYPELVHAYVGVNQVVDRAAEEDRCRNAAMALAEARGDRKALEALARLPPKDELIRDIDALLVLKTVTREMGIVSHDPAFFRAFAKAVILAPEFTWTYLFRFVKALMVATKLSFVPRCRFDLFAQPSAVPVPIFLVAGRHDLYTSAELAGEWLAGVEAPHKELHVLDGAAHLACYEAPEAFDRILIDRVLPLAR